MAVRLREFAVMTETLPPPTAAPARPTTEDESALARRPLVAGAAAALVAAALGLLAFGLPVLLLIAAEPRADVPIVDALRAAGQLWLVVHGTALELSPGPLTLTPLGLLVVPLLLLARAGRRLVRQLGAASPRRTAGAVLAVAVPYAAATGAVALASGTAGARPDGVSALLHGLAVAVVGAGAGALRAHRRDRPAEMRLEARAIRVLRAVVGASAVLAAAGALLVGASLALHLERGADLAAAPAPGAVGGAGLLVLGLALVPNAVVWAVSWLAGPGFGVGVGTTVSPFAVELGAVPALPLLAALPGGAAPPWAALPALLLPLAAGVVAGHLLHRSAAAPGSRARALLDAATAGASCGAAWAALAGLSGGAVGGLRLAEVGPSPWRVGLAVAAEVGLGVLVVRLVLGRRR